MDKFDIFKIIDKYNKTEKTNRVIYEKLVVNNIVKILKELPISIEDIDETKLVQAYINKKRQATSN